MCSLKEVLSSVLLKLGVFFLHVMKLSSNRNFSSNRDCFPAKEL